MKFNEIDWADSSIEEIKIKYDNLEMIVFNDTLNKSIKIKCTGFAGITDLCIWDDMDIYAVQLNENTISSTFAQTIISAYKDVNGNLDNSNPNRTLKQGLKDLSITLTNGITFHIFCQNINID